MTPIYDWLLFDADHTILDFDSSEAYALEAVCREVAGEFRQEWAPLYHEINKALWADLQEGRISSQVLRVERFARFASCAGIDADAQAFSSRYLKHLQEGNFVIGGARELLDRLAPDFRMAVVTNGIRETQLRRMEVTGLGRYFEHIIISEEAGAHKPMIEFFDHALGRIGSSDRSRMLVIGDSLASDIKGANAAGIPCCWYNPRGIRADGQAAPDFEIRRLEDLTDLVYR
jgi:YjjG family noncanonical pyrimidine nucleotidase